MIEPIGIITIIAGIACVAFGPAATIYVLLFSTLLGAAAAAILTFIGGSNLQPSHLLLGFAFIVAAVQPRYWSAALRSLYFPSPGFWLLITFAYGAVITVFMPRIFEGLTNVFAIARTDSGGLIALVPLASNPGNITQLIYFGGDIFCFAIFYSFAQDRKYTSTFCNAILLVAVGNIFFGLLDLLTYFTNTTELMSFIRNASYSMLIEAELGGFKRIVGSYPEASTYASTTLWLIAFVSRLWLSGVKPFFTGPLTACLVLALVFATSTTGYAGFLVYMAFEYIRLVRQVLAGNGNRTSLAFVMLSPVLLSAVIVAMALHQPTWATVQDIIQITFIDKNQSSSGVERGTWNRQAYLNLVETFGLGIGIGSTRTSSFLLAVPASLGVFGTLSYFGFISSAVFARSANEPFRAAVQNAARGALIAQLIAACIGGPFVDLGLVFIILTAITLALQEPSNIKGLSASFSRAPAQAFERVGKGTI